MLLSKLKHNSDVSSSALKPFNEIRNESERAKFYSISISANTVSVIICSSTKSRKNTVLTIKIKSRSLKD